MVLPKQRPGRPTFENRSFFLIVIVLATFAFGFLFGSFATRSKQEGDVKAAKRGWHTGQLGVDNEPQGETAGKIRQGKKQVASAVYKEGKGHRSRAAGNGSFWEQNTEALDKADVAAKDSAQKAKCRLGLGEGTLACCGHRGARHEAPENTIASFLKALELGANCLELDVALTADNHLVVLHDKTRRAKLIENLKAVTSGKRAVSAVTTEDPAVMSDERLALAERPVEELTLKEVQSWDAGGWFSAEFRGAKVPTLAEVLGVLWGEEVMLMMDLKLDCSAANTSCATHEAAFTAAFVALLKDPSLMKPPPEWAKRSPSSGSGRPRFSLLLASFNHPLVNSLAAALDPKTAQLPLSPNIAGTGYIVHPKDDAVGKNFRSSVGFLCPLYKQTAQLSQFWKGTRQVATWVVDELEEMLAQVTLGVRAIVTNNPALCSRVCA